MHYFHSIHFLSSPYVAAVCAVKIPFLKVIEPSEPLLVNLAVVIVAVIPAEPSEDLKPCA
jgi:hypothetical protein